mmetsp:Transcript_39719/g.102255  ORF Transcript_39719/g.102255 Transcript_39719/m.102255 type:complete len:431 (+) Transcript_39719:3121-4413(+)
MCSPLSLSVPLFLLHVASLPHTNQKRKRKRKKKTRDHHFLVDRSFRRDKKGRADWTHSMDQRIKEWTKRRESKERKDTKQRRWKEGPWGTRFFDGERMVQELGDTAPEHPLMGRKKPGSSFCGALWFCPFRCPKEVSPPRRFPFFHEPRHDLGVTRFQQIFVRFKIDVIFGACIQDGDGVHQIGKRRYLFLPPSTTPLGGCVALFLHKCKQSFRKHFYIVQASNLIRFVPVFGDAIGADNRGTAVDTPLALHFRRAKIDQFQRGRLYRTALVRSLDGLDPTVCAGWTLDTREKRCKIIVGIPSFPIGRKVRLGAAQVQNGTGRPKDHVVAADIAMNKKFLFLLLAVRRRTREGVIERKRVQEAHLREQHSPHPQTSKRHGLELHRAPGVSQGHDQPPDSVSSPPKVVLLLVEGETANPPTLLHQTVVVSL